MEASVHVRVDGTDARREHTIVVPREAICCPLCEEPFETTEPRTPCVTTCFHTFCRLCLQAWAKEKGAVAGVGAAGALYAADGFSCPTCRAVCTVAVEALQLNFALMTVVEAERVSTGQTQLVCQECEDGMPTSHCLE